MPPRVQAKIIARSLGAELVAEHGLASLPSLPEDADWSGRFLDDPTARGLGLRSRVADRTGRHTWAPK